MEDWFHQMSNPRKIKDLLTYLLTLQKLEELSLVVYTEALKSHRQRDSCKYVTSTLMCVYNVYNF